MDQIAKRGNPNWKPGTSGNVNGRPPGIVDARHKFTTAFMHDLADSWSANGAAVLAKVAASSPEAYFAVCARLCPANVQLSIETQSAGGLQPDDIVVLRAIKQALPNAGELEPQAVLNHVLEAVRAYGAKVIEPQK
jgi:hypothetical protein